MDGCSPIWELRPVTGFFFCKNVRRTILQKPVKTNCAVPATRPGSSDFFGGSTEGEAFCAECRDAVLCAGWRVKDPPQVKGSSHCPVKWRGAT